MVVVIRTGTSRICFAPDCTTCCWYIELVRIFTHIWFWSYQLTLKAIGYFIFPSVLLFNLYRRYFLFFFFKISTRGLYISLEPKALLLPFLVACLCFCYPENNIGYKYYLRKRLYRRVGSWSQMARGLSRLRVKCSTVSSLLYMRR